ncbi:LysR family transcriptional regulator [Vibrio astriarenae]|uniref:LysR family transcriptional regulator n=1 Tax=Vibrio astriarenae TaxID=1481923 RepID=A0A7Z2T693_9VIBR|nr:LysR family transcriptional regulator [Vibrio astriarenae]QIA64912.1 LysR family transcriptional regulator [Vibrio astriarenae]
MLDQVNLADVRSFVLIAQKGNFTKAAETLGVSRSHVSRQISNLEKQMGVTLFIRTTRTLRLTDAGDTFFQQCDKALHDIDQALLSAVDEVEIVRGEIRVNCVGGYLGEDVVAEIASQFMKQHREVSVNLDFSSHRVDLIEEYFDVAFRMGKLDDAGFIARKIMDVEMSTLASTGYLQSYGRPSHPKELVNHHCLTGSVKRWSWHHRTEGQHYDMNVSGQLQCKNGRVLVRGALNGNGIIRVPSVYCTQEVEQGKLVEVFDDWVVPSVDFSIIYHRDKFQPKRIRAFIDFVYDYFSRS